MDQERFEALASAFGGEIGRWPAADRAAALAFAADHPQTADRMTGGEHALDGWLAAWPDAQPSHDLRERIILAAPRERATGRAWRWLTGLGVGVGLAAACAGGVAAGLALTPASITRVIVHPAASSAPADPADEVSDLVAPSNDAAEGA